MDKEKLIELKKDVLNIYQSILEYSKKPSPDIITDIYEDIYNLSEEDKLKLGGNVMNINDELASKLNIRDNLIKSIKDGGPGSGNYNHGGRPGSIGGSSSYGEGSMVPQNLIKEPPALVNMEYIYQKLKEAGANNSKQATEKFGLLPKVLLERLKKRLEMGEDNWNSVFKNKEEYLKAKNLKESLESNQAIENPEYKKISKAIARWEFINSIAIQIETSGNLLKEQPENQDINKEGEDGQKLPDKNIQ